MASLTSIRNKLAAKVFNKIGSTITRTPFSSTSLDKWGDGTVTYGTAESVTAVPYDYIRDREFFGSFGELKEGEVIIIFKHDQSLSKEDKISFDSKNYRIKEIEHYYYNDGVIAKSAVCAKIL